MRTVQSLLTLTMLVGFTTMTSESPVKIDISLQPREDLQFEETRQWKYDLAYDALVDTLMWHEGYRAYPYLCLAEVLTVGYGHTIKKGETFDYPLSQKDAKMLLHQDLNNSINFVKTTTDLEHLQLLAIAHFVYALGSGSFEKSTLRELIMDDLPIDKEIVKWVHIRTKNGIIRSEYLLASRIMELELYNSI